MSVILTVVEGPLTGAKYRFDERMVCILGRAENCALRIPPDGADGISRHHCLLDVDPPSISIQDLGSKYGTTVNGVEIGSQGAQALPLKLKSGDTFKVGHLLFHVELNVSAQASEKQVTGQPAKQPSPLETCTLSKTALDNMDGSLLHIEGFKVIKQLGRGGMGAVYLAKEKASGRLVALKIMLPSVAFDLKSRDEFLREAGNSIALKHPNIVEAYSAGYSGGALYIALEYCADGSLKTVMARRKAPLPLTVAMKLTLQMLDALDYAHNVNLPSVKLSDGRAGAATGLVHRDVKPENIFLLGTEPDWVVKIADFGLAKAFETAGLSGCTITGDFSGTLGFIPRQQFLNFKYVKPEVDVWAVAASLYWMLTLHTPRDFGANPFDAIMKTRPMPFEQRGIAVPKPLAQLLDSALDDSTTLRFKAAAQFKKALLETL